MDINTKSNSIKFDSKQQLQHFLCNRIFELNQDNEYNIMAHEIKHHIIIKGKSIKENLRAVMSYIFKYGFDVNGYLTIFGTMALVGNSQNPNSAEKIVNYSYYNDHNNKMICLFAIPKYVTVDGNLMEFSSFNGTSAKHPDKKLAKAYKSKALSPDFHDYKCCLLDLIKNSNLPKCYTLGAIEIDKLNQQYIYHDYTKHLSYRSDNFKTQFYEDVENKIISVLKKYQTPDLSEIIVNEYIEDLAWINEQLDFDI